MKPILITLILFGLFNNKQNKPNFSNSEIKLFEKIGFEKEDFIEIKSKARTNFLQFEISEPGYMIGSDGTPVKTGVEKKNGLSFKVSEDKTDEIIFAFKDQLKQKGYLIFLSENGYKGPSTISIIRANDQFKIIELQKTDGINYGFENKDIIEKLKKWNSKYGIEIIGADYDWVDILIEQPVKDSKIFSEEVYKFCPDAVEQGVEELEQLEIIIRKNRRLFLWWD